ncbi:hypothetical protein QOZ80_5AG0404380 [Eleusine coracana subsp. coracana]|nr:hypothetical protein QOZ80_5AG0404380 [Eleusine coracana subsp. coracana]
MPGFHMLLGILFFCSLQHTHPCSAAVINGSLVAGQVLTVGDTLVSRNGKFALGFFQPTAPATLSKSIKTTTSPNWYLGIWFNKIPVFTTVWVANRETPITGPNINQTQLKLTSDANLVVLIRTGSPSSDVLLWQSFDHPTNVALPGAKCGRNKKTGLNQQLGAGGFGSVFKGMLSDSTPIAVKRLNRASDQREKQFRAEVSSIGLIQHINLIKLIGFCCDGDNRLLVYEHMSNGSLDGHLFKSTAAVLNWNTRYHIILGVARGLSYLHQSCRECIIHCDIKPENILLDASFVPKVADFGMAAFVGRDLSRVLTTIRGTAGYLAPEWLRRDAITPKIDVYGFGMVLLEIISGGRNSPGAYNSSNYHVEYFPVQAINKLHDGDVQSLVDPRLHGNFSLEQVERVCKLAYWCIQDNEFDRPTMGEVVHVLEGLQEIDMPPMPRLLAAIIEH